MERSIDNRIDGLRAKMIPESRGDGIPDVVQVRQFATPCRFHAARLAEPFHQLAGVGDLDDKTAPAVEMKGQPFKTCFSTIVGKPVNAKFIGDSSCIDSDRREVKW